MLFPRHPQPVCRRREVAAAVVATRQAATIGPGHVIVVPGKPAPPEPAAVTRTPEQGGLLSRNGHDTPV
jgi:hypothetical protein